MIYLDNLKCIGEIELGTKVDITDPCYDRDTLCIRTEECEPGRYKCYIDTTKDYYGHVYATSLSIFKNKPCKENELDCIGTVGADAGMVGFFNNKPDFTKDQWRNLCKKTYEEINAHAWIMYGGVFAYTIGGDGEFHVYTNEEKNAFAIDLYDINDKYGWW